MTSSKRLLLGKCKFVKTEGHNGTEWESLDLTEGLTWEFYPEYISKERTIGVIIESVPKVDPVKLNYTYSNCDNYLRIEVYSDPETRIKDELDIYKVIFTEEGSSNKHATIVIELINQIGCPSPYLRYTLQQVL